MCLYNNKNTIYKFIKILQNKTKKQFFFLKIKLKLKKKKKNYFLDFVLYNLSLDHPLNFHYFRFFFSIFQKKKIIRMYLSY
jgi:hypothetical protein